MDKTLDAVESGDCAMIMGVEGGEKVKTRLESLGLIPGVQVDVLNNANGQMVVGLDTGRIMVEQGVARNVRVI